MSMNQKDILLSKISELLYAQYIGNEDSEMPKDEYDPEARILMDVLQKVEGHVSTDYIASELANIFTDMFDNNYSKDDFILVSAKIKLLYDSAERQTINIFASKRKDGSFQPEEVIVDLEIFFAGLEYGDVTEGECQIWKYPNGNILQITSDRIVLEDNYYSTPYTTKGTVWLPKLVKKEVDQKKVMDAYSDLMSTPEHVSFLRRFLQKLLKK